MTWNQGVKISDARDIKRPSKAISQTSTTARRIGRSRFSWCWNRRSSVAVAPSRRRTDGGCKADNPARQSRSELLTRTAVIDQQPRSNHQVRITRCPRRRFLMGGKYGPRNPTLAVGRSHSDHHPARAVLASLTTESGALTKTGFVSGQRRNTHHGKRRRAVGQPHGGEHNPSR
jgi:hypothetical protein